jgi:hypothetical protein
MEVLPFFFKDPAALEGRDHPTDKASTVVVIA